MPSNDFQFNTDDDTYSTYNYDDYQIIGENINGQPGTRIDESGHIIPSKFFPDIGTPMTGIGNNAAHIPGR